MTLESTYELVLKTIAGLELNDETAHVEKLQLCIALARGVLDFKARGATCACLGLKIHESSRTPPYSPYHFRFDGWL